MPQHQRASFICRIIIAPSSRDFQGPFQGTLKGKYTHKLTSAKRIFLENIVQLAYLFRHSHLAHLFNAHFYPIVFSIHSQIIITTHSATIVRALAFNNIRLIRMLEGQKVIENVAPRQLPFLSLNEVNYLAFSEISEGYHNELYGYIEEMKWLKDYLDGKPTVEYTRIAKDGSLKVERIPETEYIRHQIHHPENTHNPRFTDEQLRGSIETMRAFIIAKGPAAP